ncbi:hypothetical protein BJ508DRAFT_412077 [Ascobolus immersus RN42]|uniref:Altered inheritance of mitochondria protein 21 n=1 Tax=Ascobolus immersus RN42 TaxID=1160509 RepID=A0A3N4IUM2_ASCIM|nr:hypothetical protein BJ508DRAFT_412077 [Ascobolus immersus RN42]
MSAPSELTPSIPPRPARSKTPVDTANAAPEAEAPSGANMPSIPPRPPRRPGMTPTVSSDQTPQQFATISPSVELQQPFPVSSVNKPDAEGLRKQTTATSSELGESRTVSRSESRSASSLGNYETGIPKIGSRVPMHPNAGDVQAPTPTGSKFNKNALKDVYKQQNYGEYAKTGSVERIERNNLARSAIDLNEIVEKARGGSGVGTRPDAQPVPDEDMAYLASDDFTSRMMSPEPAADEQNGRSSSHHRDVIHIDPHDARRSQATTPTPFHHASRPHSRAPSRLTDRDLLEDDEDYLDEKSGTPILASDEVHKSRSSPGTPYVPRAMSPAPVETDKKDAAPTQATAQESDTEEVEKNSLGGGYTPLKKDEDHEPLFPDEEDEEVDSKEAEKPAEPDTKATRPGIRVLRNEKARFPSQDVWEDAPEYSNLETVVSDPGEKRRTGEEEQDEESSRLPVVPRRGHSRRPSAEGVKSAVGYPHQAHEEAYPQDGRSSDRVPVAHKSHVSIPQSSLRPDSSKTGSKTKQRFPSADVWEDAPDSQMLSATVTPAPPEQQQDDEPPSPVENQKSPVESQKSPAEIQKSPIENQKTPILHQPPSIPKRETSPEKPRERPPPPTKPKPPTIPPRPAKKLIPPPPPTEKPKPAVPPKQPGKLLKTSFLGDLNSRLAKGPAALLGLKKEEKPSEPEEPPKSEEPLADIRKSRAKGPRGRKPPTAPTTSILKESSSGSGERPRYVGVWTIYEADDNGNPIAGTGITKPMTLSEIEKMLADKSRKQVDFVLPEAKTEKSAPEQPSEKPEEQVPKVEESPKTEEVPEPENVPKDEVALKEEAVEAEKAQTEEEPALVSASEPTSTPAEKDTEQNLPLTSDFPEKEVQEKKNTVVDQAEEKIKEEETAQESAPVVPAEPTRVEAAAVQDETPAAAPSDADATAAAVPIPSTTPAQDEALKEEPETVHEPAVQEAAVCAKPFQEPVKLEEPPVLSASSETPAVPAGEESKVLGEEKELGQGGRQDEPEEEKKTLVEATAGPGVEVDGRKREEAM